MNIRLMKMIRMRNLVQVIATFTVILLLNTKEMKAQFEHDDYCFFAMMLDDSGPFPSNLENKRVALLISVIDYTNIYIPVDWEKPLANRFLTRTRNLDLNYVHVASGNSLNKSEGDLKLAEKLDDLDVDYIIHYTVVYQRTPVRIKTGHTIAVMPFTGDQRIVDMAGKGHYFFGRTLNDALYSFLEKHTTRGESNKPIENPNLSEKSRVTRVERGFPVNLRKADLFVHSFPAVCKASHTPINKNYSKQYEQIDSNNYGTIQNRQKLAGMLKARGIRNMSFVFLTQDLNQVFDRNDYILVPIDDRYQSIRDFFIQIDDNSFMDKVPHDMEDPYYLFALFHPHSGTLYIPNIETRTYGDYWNSLSDGLDAIKKAY